MRMNPEVWLTADKVEYDGNRHEAHLRGSVAAHDSGRSLYANDMMYMFREHPEADGRARLRVEGDVSIADSARTLHADLAEYWPDSDSVTAIGNARGGMNGGSLVADTVAYGGRSGRMRASGNVTFADSSQDVSIRAGLYDYADSVVAISREPVLVKGQGDTSVVVVSGFMRFEERTRRAAAWDGVRMERGALHAECDSLVLDDVSDRLILYGSPRATQKTRSDSGTTVSEAHGQRIVMELEGTTIRRVIIDDNARTVATELDTTDEAQGERWIAGERIVFHISGEEVTMLEVHGQARSKYKPPPSTRDREGTNEASGDSVAIEFENGRMERVRLRGGVQGIFRPPPEAASDSASAPTAPADVGGENDD